MVSATRPLSRARRRAPTARLKGEGQRGARSEHEPVCFPGALDAGPAVAHVDASAIRGCTRIHAEVGGLAMPFVNVVLDALEQTICARRATPLPGLVYHSDRGTQYLSMRYTNRLPDAGIAPSVGSQGDAYDNALTESAIGLFKTEVIRRKSARSRPWSSLPSRGSTGSICAACSAIGDIPPAEFEAQYYAQAAVA
jgi:transposase InsO family protein